MLLISSQRKGPIKKRHIFLLFLILLTLLSIQGLLFVERNLEPALMAIANVYVKEIGTMAITEAVSKKVMEGTSEEHHIALIEKDVNQRIQLISFDQAKQARILSLVIETANQKLRELSRAPVHIPLGQAFGSTILAQFGPDIPITLVPMGAARADIEVRLNQAEINVVSIEVYIKVEADVQVVIPFSSDHAVVSTEFPIEVHILPGEVPNYYFKSGEGTITPVPNISLPN